MKEKIKKQNQKATKASSNLNSNFQPLTSDNKGITLLALIITIIIMLILVAATISVTLNSGLFAKAAKASKDWNEADQNIQGEVDNIGNYIDSIVEEATGGLENNVPLISSMTLNTKTINSFTVDVTASDSDGEELTYSLYVNGSTEPADTTTAPQGQAVQLTATNLAMYTDYTYYVEITDNTDNTESEAATVKTKCSGTTTTCATSECTGKTETACTTCTGAGTVSYTCTAGSTTKCSSCGGRGSYACGGSYSFSVTTAVTISHGSPCTAYEYSCDRCGSGGYECACNISSYSGGCRDTISCSCGNGYIEKYCEHTQATSHAASKTCGTCSGSKVTTSACEHTLTSAHNYCEHYTNTTETEHKICDHSSDGAEHE